MLYGLVTNLLVMAIYSWGLWRESKADEQDEEHDKLLPKVHGLFWISSVILLALTLPCYILSIALDPGYIERKYDYIALIETALEYGQHLDNFCSYCEIIKTQTSFHCTI